MIQHRRVRIAHQVNNTKIIIIVVRNAHPTSEADWLPKNKKNLEQADKIYRKIIMEIQIIEEDQTALKEYGRVPMSFMVRSQFRIDLIDSGLGGFTFTEEPVSPEYVKDYDDGAGEGPERWAKIWDLSRWGVLSAFENGLRIGGGVMAFDTEDVYMLEGRNDLAALWDLRVHPDYRHKGVGTVIFQSAVDWAAERGCDFLKIETQNINVPACTFYIKQGCSLGAVNRFAYPDLPHEIQMIWYKKIT